ncbi:MAG: fructosamine kinase family protein [Bacillota bacterium]
MGNDKYKQNNYPLMQDNIIYHIEKIVSRFIGSRWEIKVYEDKTELASHNCGIMSDGDYSVFVKLSDAPNARDQFECEARELNKIRELSEVKTPLVIGIITIRENVLLIMEAFKEVKRESRHWRDIGRSLAKLHKIKSENFGFENHGYFGPLFQDNRPMADWETFYIERRVLPYLKMAVNSGNLPKYLIGKIKKLVKKIPDLNGPKVKPSLLHGDAQQNNYISTEEGTVIIDTSLYYGHPEVDLSLIDYFQPVPDDVFQGYQEIRKLDPGFETRKDLYRISSWLACVTVDGSYLNNLKSAVNKYI